MRERILGPKEDEGPKKTPEEIEEENKRIEFINNYNTRDLFKTDYLNYKEDYILRGKQSKDYLKVMSSKIGIHGLRMAVNNYYYNIKHKMAAVLVKNCDR